MSPIRVVDVHLGRDDIDKALRADIEAWNLYVHLGIGEGAPAKPQVWLAQRLKALGVETGEDMGLIEPEISKGRRITQQKVDSLVELLRGDQPFPDLRGRTILLVDEGIASSITMETAIAALKRAGASKIIVAVATGYETSLQTLTDQVAEVYCANVRGGWGYDVTTAGYGDLQGGPATEEYTATFSGTSSATPIVTGAAVQLNGIHRECYGADMDPLDLRDLITATGTPQNGTQNIGPRPNVREAIVSLEIPRTVLTGSLTIGSNYVVSSLGQPNDACVSSRSRHGSIFTPMTRASAQLSNCLPPTIRACYPTSVGCSMITTFPCRMPRLQPSVPRRKMSFMSPAGMTNH